MKCAIEDKKICEETSERFTCEIRDKSYILEWTNTKDIFVKFTSNHYANLHKIEEEFDCVDLFGGGERASIVTSGLDDLKRSKVTFLYDLP